MLEIGLATGRGYRFVANLRDQVGLVIATQTVSQITVGQETEDDGDAIIIPANSTAQQ